MSRFGVFRTDSVTIDSAELKTQPFIGWLYYKKPNRDALKYGDNYYSLSKMKTLIDIFPELSMNDILEGNTVTVSEPKLVSEKYESLDTCNLCLDLMRKRDILTIRPPADVDSFELYLNAVFCKATYKVMEIADE